MRWIIKNPAPSGPDRDRWGDSSFGECLAVSLRRLRQEVRSQYFGDWESDAPADVTLVLRGKHRLVERPRGLAVLWIISHPETVSARECAQYGLVFAASALHAKHLSARLGRPVHTLLQCTDSERFSMRGGVGPRRGVVFVGSSRWVERRSVLWAIEEGLPVRIWGRDWQAVVDKRFLVGDWIDNDALPEIYNRAGFTLNDHWDGMRRWGYINNRVFDALACGLPVLSDHNETLAAMFPRSVLTFRDRAGFSRCVERMILQHPRLLEAASRDSASVRSEHSFASRAKDLLEQVQQVLG
ncbi:MAG: glycosyltransferase family 1 protein [Deltaproteobacteria bacterium]|nr:glycosyltransferase family 1 protein [Deltaproteobacteria bacterium]